MRQVVSVSNDGNISHRLYGDFNHPLRERRKGLEGGFGEVKYTAFSVKS